METNRIYEKIKDTRSSAKFHKRIAEIEDQISKDRETEKIEAERIHIMVENLSRLKQIAKEELLRQQDMLSQRQGIKRVHYQDLLSYIQKEEFELSLNAYEERVKILFGQGKALLAEIDLAVVVMLLFKLKQKSKLIPIRSKFRKGNGLVSQVIDFLITLIDYSDQSIHFQAIRLFENLALFPEEKALLHQLVKLSIGSDPDATKSIEIGAIQEGRLNIAHINTNRDKLSTKEFNFKKREDMERKYWKDAIDNIRAQNYSDAAREYFDKIELLVTNNHEEFFPVSLVMGVMCLIKVSKHQEAKRKLDKIVLDVNLPQDIIQNLPEKILLELLLLANKLQDQERADLIYEVFYDYLPLFSQEKGLIFNFLSPSIRTKKQQKENADKNIKVQSIVLHNQQYSELDRRSSEAHAQFEESFQQRSALRRMRYRKVLEMLTNENYENASKEYVDLAMKHTHKRDYDTASVLILLGSLSLFKESAQISIIQSYLNEFISKIGFSEKVVSETFAVKLLKLLIDTKTIGNTAIFDSAWNLLQIIPVFDEEKILFEK